MKIIKDNYKKEDNKKEYNVVCEYCNSELFIEDSDITVGDYGMGRIICPCCGNETYPEELSDFVTLTKDNIKFPIHYAKFGKSNGCVKLSDEAIDKEVRRLLQTFDDNDDNDWFRYWASGDTIIFVMKLVGDGEYNIYVCKNYYETFLNIN